jgi:predicted NAD-dependent protein-ADP-ribosyltransferase YbiA (DUF1768 family)
LNLLQGYKRHEEHKGNSDRTRSREAAAVKVRLKPNLLIVTAESEDEVRELIEWAGQFDGHAFSLKLQDGQTFCLKGLGPQADACREPINVVSTSTDPDVQLISNFAHTPFELDGKTYASVEGFWQGLKFPDETKRREVGMLAGVPARGAAFDAPESEEFIYEGRTIRIGSPEHWRLMALACWAKFSQHEEAKRALLKTGERPLIHKTRRDSRTIPGVIMADIWMSVRRGLVKRLNAPD